MQADRTYFVYILASRSRNLYIGVTNSLIRRLSEHKAGRADSFTRRYRIHRLVYYERFQYINNAVARETELKGWLRARKIALIESTNPVWADLSEEFGTAIKFEEADSSSLRSSE